MNDNFNNDESGEQQSADPAQFEELMKELEGIVKRLEQGDLPLADGIASFERGVQLSRRAKAILDAAEARVEQLSADDPSQTQPLPEL